MATYSFLSGSTIDNIPKLYLEKIISGNTYLGFSRGTYSNAWGYYALINVSAEVSAGAGAYKTTSDTSAVFATSGQPNSAIPVMFRDLKSPITGDNSAFIRYGSNNISINIIEGNESWLLVQMQNPPVNYYQLLNAAKPIYIYKKNSPSNTDPRFKILNKYTDNIPSYIIPCILTTSDDVQITGYATTASQLSRSISILGETYISGLLDFTNLTPATSGEGLLNNLNVLNKYQFTFKLKDLSDNILIDNMIWVDPGNGNTYTIVNSVDGKAEKFITFAVSSTTGYTQYIKVCVGIGDSNTDLAIWDEVINYGGSVSVSDTNPPALEVSYLRTPLIERSIFDVNGLYKIPISSASYVKEILNTTDYNKYNIMASAGINIITASLSGDQTIHRGILINIASNGDTIINLGAHTLIIGDQIDLPNNGFYPDGAKNSYTITGATYSSSGGTISISPTLNTINPIQVGYEIKTNANSAIANLQYATTTDYKTAMKYGLCNVMLQFSVPTTSTVGSQANSAVYENLYRQVFICNSPSGSDGLLCTLNSYNAPIYNWRTHNTEIGSLLYVANRQPVLRNLSASSENFTIIL